MRRTPDFSRPRPDPIGFTGWFLIAIASLVAAASMAGLLLLAVATTPANARDVGQWEGTNPIIRQWYKTLMQPDNPGISCCGEADGYWADEVEVKDGKVYAIITDTRDDRPLGRIHVPPGTRIEVPPHKITWKHGNPTGHIIIFLGSDRSVLCYVQSGGV